MFECLPSAIPGCYEIRPRVFMDLRGKFVKTFQRDFFAEHGLNVEWPEEYYSISKRGVLRGLHFQLPPHDLVKIVYCTAGEVLDAVVDLRIGSATFGQHAIFRLTADTANMVYLPRGLAHGFLTISESATMMYKVSSVYNQEHDAGILWNSAGINWATFAPVLSERDANFPPLQKFYSPFLFNLEDL